MGGCVAQRCRAFFRRCDGCRVFLRGRLVTIMTRSTGNLYPSVHDQELQERDRLRRVEPGGTVFTNEPQPMAADAIMEPERMPGRELCLDLCCFGGVLAAQPQPRSVETGYTSAEEGSHPAADSEAEGKTKFGGRLKVESRVNFGDSAKAS